MQTSSLAIAVRLTELLYDIYSINKKLRHARHFFDRGEESQVDISNIEEKVESIIKRLNDVINDVNKSHRLPIFQVSKRMRMTKTLNENDKIDLQNAIHKINRRMFFTRSRIETQGELSIHADERDLIEDFAQRIAILEARVLLY
jgi:hypothetical protein